MSEGDLEVRTAHHVEDIGQRSWDAFNSGQPFASYDWYRYGERAMPNCPPFYVCISKRGEALARASFWLIRDEPLPVSNRLVRGSLQRFLSARPLLVCRSPLADTSGLMIPASQSSCDAFDRILSCAEDFSRSVKASFLVFDYLNAQQAGFGVWRDRFQQVQMSEPGTSLAVRWNNFDEYLEGLSKSAWKDYRRQQNQAQRLGLAVVARAAVDVDIDEALPLIRNVEDRHGAAPRPWARTMLENLAGMGATWIEARQAGRMVGCGLLLADGDTRLATLLGLDYSVPYVYFQIMYAAIREVISQGARLLRAGSGAYELKRRLGFQPEANTYLRFSGQTRLLGQLGRFASAFV